MQEITLTTVTVILLIWLFWVATRKKKVVEKRPVFLADPKYIGYWENKMNMAEPVYKMIEADFYLSHTDVLQVLNDKKKVQFQGQEYDVVLPIRFPYHKEGHQIVRMRLRRQINKEEI